MNFLFIPHTPQLKGRIRSLELARATARRFTQDSVYYLNWFEVTDTRYLHNLPAQVRHLFKAVRSWRPDTQSLVTFISMPFLYRPFSVAQRLHRRHLQRILSRFEIDILVNASLCYIPAPMKRQFRSYVYDVVDDHFGPPIKNWKEGRRLAAIEMAKADLVTACSNSLAAKIESKFGYPARFLPNGSWQAQFSFSPTNAPADCNSTLRERWGIPANRRIIGMVGAFHDVAGSRDWTGARFLMSSFLDLIKNDRSLHLLLVGGGPVIDELKMAHGTHDHVTFTGWVHPDTVASYFGLLDIGVIPFEPSAFTHHALPLKAIEYGMAGKWVVSTPLKELQNSAFPNIIFQERKSRLWQSALVSALERRFQPDWKSIYSAYDWPRIAGTLRAWAVEGIAA